METNEGKMRSRDKQQMTDTDELVLLAPGWVEVRSRKPVATPRALLHDLGNPSTTSTSKASRGWGWPPERAEAGAEKANYIVNATVRMQAGRHGATAATRAERKR